MINRKLDPNFRLLVLGVVLVQLATLKETSFVVLGKGELWGTTVFWSLKNDGWQGFFLLLAMKIEALEGSEYTLGK